MHTYRIATLTCMALAAGVAYGQTSLGAFTFNDNQFGNTLTESDGGTFSSTNWLNVVNVDPGNPSYLTGANFDTVLHLFAFETFNNNGSKARK